MIGRERSLLAQLRIGVLPIHIETGRFRNVKPEDRVCQICDSNSIEDEFHLVCICSFYAKKREVLYNSITSKNHEFISMPDKEKIVYIIKHEWKLLATYLNNVWNKRNAKLYVTT